MKDGDGVNSPITENANEHLSSMSELRSGFKQSKKSKDVNNSKLTTSLQSSAETFTSDSESGSESSIESMKEGPAFDLNRARF